ncbi:hypothetical protein AURDEDRAFT_183527 [Auricularia subglabra TFB-10046 SS5]|nr:hypothetical protein AURDEDRAFT_183527 [Auricularia subglabra TFB-10046 SS5]
MSKTPSAMDRGTSALKAGKYEEAAMSTPSLKAPAVESRAAAYMKMGKLPEALQDAKQCIDLAPKVPAGYIRAARVFKALNKPEPALRMVEHASQRIKPTDTRRAAELKKLKEEILELQSEIARLVKATACHLAMLPVEILAEVFQYLLPDDWDAPLRLGAVCKHWRSVVQNAPAMWSCLHLGGRSNVERILRAKAMHWNDKSRYHVKHLELNDRVAIQVYQKCCSPTRLRSLETVRLFHVARGIHAQLEPLSETFCWDLASLPTVRSLAFNFGVNLIVLADGDAARLSHLHELEMVAYMIVAGAQPSFPNLRRLHIDASNFRVDSDPPHGLRALLETCPALEHLHVTGVSPENNTTEGTGPLPCDRLRSLELHNDVCRWSLWSTSLPESVTLERLVASPPQAASSFLSLFRSVALASLRELRLLAVCDTAPAALLPLLRAMPHLAVLQLSRASGDMGALVDGLPAAGLPLTDVDFSDCAKLPGSPIVRLVRARAGALRAMRVDGCPLVEADLLPWLRSNVPAFSCVYMTRKQAKGQRFLG